MSTKYHNIAAIVLAAGKGTRMKSSKAKVLHFLAGRPMISYVIETAIKVVGNDIVVVIGHQADAVRRHVSNAGQVFFAYQENQLGTGHAVQCALPSLPADIENVIILCGDVPLITEQTLTSLVDAHLNGQYAVTVLGVNLEDPSGYGRVVTDGNGDVVRIVEDADAAASEKCISTINSGVYCVHRSFLEGAITRLKSDNAQNEIYLTDIIEIATHSKRPVGMMLAEKHTELLGINTLEELKRVEALLDDQ